MEADGREGLRVVPVSLAQAARFVEVFHRHHRRLKAHKFSVGVARESDGHLVGVAIVGRPVSRTLDDGATLEVSRTCTDGTPNANSALYGATWRAAKAMGYSTLITYCQQGESGASLRGAGWWLLDVRRPRGGWDMPNRSRDDHHQTGIPRTLWGIGDTGRLTDPDGCNESPPAVVVIGNETRCAAPGCGVLIEQPATGRRRRFCSGTCRVRAHRSATATG